MGLQFLVPLFLAGILAVAIPVVIHLTHRERREPVAFPSLMFLRRIPFRTTRRQRLRHLLLFVLRAGAIALLAMAFARPWLAGVGGGVAGSGESRAVAVILDRSYSMLAGDRWERAVRAAREAVEGLGAEDRGVLVRFADRAEAATPVTGDRGVLLAALEQTTIGGGATRLGPALRVARDLLEASDRSRREAIVISDFQQGAWEGEEDVRLPGGTTLRLVDVTEGGEPLANVGVTAAFVERLTSGGRERARIAARIANPSGAPVANRRVRLLMEGRVADTRSVTIPPAGAALVTFAPQAILASPVLAAVQIDGDAFPADDEYRLLLEPPRPIPVVVLVAPRQAEGALYLRRALEVGDDPAFSVRVLPATQLRAADLEDRPVVILHDTPYPGRAVAGLLARHRAGGGGLLLALGERSDFESWPQEAQAQFGVTAAGVVDRWEGRGGAMSVVRYDHPVFEPFVAPQSGDFSSVRIWRYRRLDPTRAAVLARHDDGTPALLEAADSAGRSLAWAGDLADRWSDLPIRAVFVPFLHRAVRYLAGYRPVRTEYRVGEAIETRELARRLGGSDSVTLVVESPRGDRIPIAADASAFVVGEIGVYRVRPVGAPGDEAVRLAVNLDPSEADLGRLDAEAFRAAVAPRSAVGAGPGQAASAGLAPRQVERRQGLWWYLLVAVLVLLGFEGVVAARTRGVARRASTRLEEP